MQTPAQWNACKPRCGIDVNAPFPVSSDHLKAAQRPEQDPSRIVGGSYGAVPSPGGLGAGAVAKDGSIGDSDMIEAASTSASRAR